MSRAGREPHLGANEEDDRWTMDEWLMFLIPLTARQGIACVSKGSKSAHCANVLDKPSSV